MFVPVPAGHGEKGAGPAKGIVDHHVGSRRKVLVGLELNAFENEVIRKPVAGFGGGLKAGEQLLPVGEGPGKVLPGVGHRKPHFCRRSRDRRFAGFPGPALGFHDGVGEVGDAGLAEFFGDVDEEQGGRDVFPFSEKGAGRRFILNGHVRIGGGKGDAARKEMPFDGVVADHREDHLFVKINAPDEVVGAVKHAAELAFIEDLPAK